MMLLAVSPVDAEERWVDMTRGLSGAHVNMMTFAGPSHLPVLAGAGVVWQWSGSAWRPLLDINGVRSQVHDLLFDRDAVWGLAATADGLFRTRDGGRHWMEMFTGGGGKRIVLSLAGGRQDGDSTVWAGTAGGLLVSRDWGDTWEIAGGSLPWEPVWDVAVAPEAPFAPEGTRPAVAAIVGNAVFVSEDGGASWSQRLAMGGAAEESESEEDESPEQEEAFTEDLPKLTSLVMPSMSGVPWYVTTTRGVMSSGDMGTTWRWLPLAGLGHSTVHHGTLWRERLVAATAQGVFEYVTAQQRWSPVGAGLSGMRIRCVTVEPGAGPADEDGGALWAATEEGVYRLGASERFLEIDGPGARADGPSIQSTHSAAIAYANVSPAKILHWQRAASLKAALPTVSVSYDKDRNISDRFDEGNYPAYQVVDSKDVDDNWTVSASWNLSDLVWNSAQTSIDTRSRLMVQLRDDILDEVNRLYFERRRLLALGNSADDAAKRVEQQIRLAELVAGLDALTGGWFSQQLDYAHNQEAGR